MDKAHIHITMLGNFDILVDGKSALKLLGNANKSILLLKYLIFNSGKPLSVSDLIDHFWADPDKSICPEVALKTMVSRIRFSLSKAHPSLKTCIISENCTYRWNMDINCTVDVFMFEERCKKLKFETTFTPSTKKRYLVAIESYNGNFSNFNTDEDWLISRSLYLHHLYLKTVYRFVALLKQQQDYSTIIYACRLALDIDIFDENLNYELMHALKQTGQTDSAFAQYHQVKSAYNNYLGLDIPKKIVSTYHELIKQHTVDSSEIEAFATNLIKEIEHISGPLVCDYSIFDDIYHLQVRLFERDEMKLFLVLVSVINPFEEHTLKRIAMDQIMHNLLKILTSCLRKGDVVSRYSVSQYVMLLPMMKHADSQPMISCIKTMFYNNQFVAGLKLNFQVYCLST